MIKTDFVINKGFKWYSNKNISVKGFLFDSDNTYFEKEKLLDVFENIKTKDELLKCIQNANGLFTVFIKLSENDFLLANDIIRVFPVFYSKRNNDIYLTDDIQLILNELKLKELNLVSKNEFLSAGFVSGHNTLINNVQVTQSGEISQICDTEINTEFYSNYYTSSENNSAYNVQKEQLKDNLDSAFKRLAHSFNGRKAVIPLSGGFDSRFIACKLKELGYNNVLCYSYGNLIDNKEKETSQKVAKKLGFDWEFIEYNKDIVGNYMEDEIFSDFWQFYSQFSTAFMFHDYFAVKHFKEKNIIPLNSIFISGHSGDFLGGSQLYKNGGIKKGASFEKIAKSIFNNRYLLAKLNSSDEKEITNSIYLSLQQQFRNNETPLAYSLIDNWDIKEKLSKNNANTTRIYDFFSYEFRLPYWDNSLANFCKTIPYEYKYGKILYDDVLRDCFKKFDVNFDEGRKLNPEEFKFYQFKQLIKRVIPSKISRFLKPNSDFLNYDLAQSPLKEELKQNGFSIKRLKHRNSVFTYWQLMQTEKLIHKM